jgi:predicted ATP-grasp superfamily ATP-dependent carboligase
VEIRPPVLLLGSDCLTGLQIARILWRQGVSVIGVADRPGSPYRWTRALRRTVEAAALGDPEALLRAIGAEHGQRPVIMPCTDEHASWLATHQDRLRDHAHFLVPEAKVLERLSDKARFSRWIAERGRPRLPETRVVERPEEIEQAAREMRFPVVVKPPNKTAAWLAAASDAKACRVDGPEALLALAPGLQRAIGALVLQTWVPGDDAWSRELSFCLDAQGERVADVVLQKLRLWPDETGTGSLAVQVEDDEVREAALEMLRALGYAGPGQIEFKRDERDGTLCVIEVNPGRAALNFPLAEASGVALTLSWYCAAAGLPLPAERRVTRPGARWICWKRDLPAAFLAWRAGRLGLREWLRSIRGPRWSADLRLDDPVPQLAELVQRVAKALRRGRPAAKPIRSGSSR